MVEWDKFFGSSEADDSMFGSGKEFESLIEETTGPKAVVKGSRRAARLAFVDMLFSWPPNGGADTDLHNVISGMQRAGYPVHLFGVHEIGSTDRGRFEPEEMSFPATRLDTDAEGLRPERLMPRMVAAVDAWRPDIVFVQHGFALKPYLLRALTGRRVVARYYAHELACARDPLRFKNGRHCENDFLRTPQICRTCALSAQRRCIQNGDRPAWTADYLAAEAYRPHYRDFYVQALASADAIVVSNTAMREHLRGFHDNVFIVPGGVHTRSLRDVPLPAKGPDEKKIILMAGRADDRLKGLRVLLEAAERLASKRSDFEVWATHFDHTRSVGWFKALGWHDHATTLMLYSQADICVVPSIWEEPFGLVAVEAMAAGRPVVASRVGGLKEIVQDAETGFLFERGDVQALAGLLDVLLDDARLRQNLGMQGRILAVKKYDWKNVIRQCYVPLVRLMLGETQVDDLWRGSHLEESNENA